jgi:hypothetical protein
LQSEGRGHHSYPWLIDGKEPSRAVRANNFEEENKEMITSTTPRRSWAAGALVLTTILVGSAVQMTAADSTGKQQASNTAR